MFEDRILFVRKKSVLFQYMFLVLVLFTWWQGTNKTNTAPLISKCPITAVIISHKSNSQDVRIVSHRTGNLFFYVCMCTSITFWMWCGAHKFATTAFPLCILKTKSEHSMKHNGWRFGLRVAVLNPYTADLANCVLNRVPLNSAVPTFKQQHTWHALICRWFAIFDV